MIRCECNKTFAHTRSLLRHQANSCILNKDKPTFTCPSCQYPCTRKDILDKHMLTCSSLPLSTQTITEHSHNVTTNNTNTNSNNNNRIAVNNINHYNFNYTADLSSDNVIEKIVYHLKDYIRKGEEGVADFMIDKFFTNPKDENQIAIVCINYNQQKFAYSVTDDETPTPSVKEDYKLVHLESEYLSQYNDIICDILNDKVPHYKELKGKTDKETKQNVQEFISQILTRKKLSALMASKIRAKKESKPSRILTKDMIREKFNEVKKDCILAGVYNAEPEEHKSIDDELSRAEFTSSSKASVPQEKDEVETKKESKYDRWHRESAEEDKRRQEEADEKVRKRKEKEQKRAEAEEMKEKIRRANEIAKRQAQQEKLEKKKQQLDAKTRSKSGSTPVELLEPINELE